MQLSSEMLQGLLKTTIKETENQAAFAIHHRWSMALDDVMMMMLGGSRTHCKWRIKNGPRLEHLDKMLRC
jgi:hypothetical protein